MNRLVRALQSPRAARLMLIILVLIGIAAIAAIAVAVLRDRAEPAPGMALEQAFAGIDALARQFPPPGDAPLSWPRDHGAKTEQFTESWLFAGVLEDDAGGRYGFQLAFHRLAVQLEPPERVSSWATRDLYRARYSIEPVGTPASGGERLSRAALALAGASEAPAAAWVEDWRFMAEEGQRSFRLQGGSGENAFTLHLSLPDTQPQRVDAPSYRGYWWPGLQVAGHLRVDGRERAVRGHAMLDRLWGRALPVGRGQQALVRLWFEAGDGRAVRCAQLRRREGGGMPVMECLGSPATAGDIELEPDPGGWEVVAGIRYPLRWTVRLSGSEASARIAPLSSEYPVSLDRSWSGIVVGGADDTTRWGLLELSNFAPP
jgi:predicted secreted hydrolase